MSVPTDHHTGWSRVSRHTRTFITLTVSLHISTLTFETCLMLLIYILRGCLFVGKVVVNSCKCLICYVTCFQSLITGSVSVVMVTINKAQTFRFVCLISADVCVSDLLWREITSPAEHTGKDNLISLSWRRIWGILSVISPVFFQTWGICIRQCSACKWADRDTHQRSSTSQRSPNTTRTRQTADPGRVIQTSAGAFQLQDQMPENLGLDTMAVYEIAPYTL